MLYVDFIVRLGESLVKINNRVEIGDQYLKVKHISIK